MLQKTNVETLGSSPSGISLTAPPAAQLQHTPLKPPLGPLTTLNPPSSRFMLSISLLGRGKVPLGSVLGKERENGVFLLDPFMLLFKSSMLI